MATLIPTKRERTVTLSFRCHPLLSVLYLSLRHHQDAEQRHPARRDAAGVGQPPPHLEHDEHPEGVGGQLEEAVDAECDSGDG